MKCEMCGRGIQKSQVLNASLKVDSRIQTYEDDSQLMTTSMVAAHRLGEAQRQTCAANCNNEPRGAAYSIVLVQYNYSPGGTTRARARRKSNLLPSTASKNIKFRIKFINSIHSFKSIQY